MKVEDYYNLNDRQIEQFEDYKKLLISWNEKINLTAITDEDQIVLKHFIDSLTISKFIDDNSRIIDVGTGAGFPGIPLKIYNDTLKVTLVDALNKRIAFLDEAIQNLKLNEICAIHSRAEDLARVNGQRECYDYAVSRAVANLSTLVEYLLPFVKVGGECICMKGPNIEDEIDNSKNAIEILGGKIEKVEGLVLPDSDMIRNIIIIKKIRRTDFKYPRKAGIPVKKPL